MDEFARAAFRELDARRTLRHRTFYGHLTVWAVANLFLVVVWAVTGGGFPWFVFPLFGWGVGVAAHGAAAFLAVPPGDLALENERRRLADDDAGAP